MFENGIRVNWFYGTEHIPLNPDALSTKTTVRSTKQVWHDGSGHVEYNVTSRVRKVGADAFVVFLKYDDASNSHLDLVAGTSTIKICVGAAEGKATFVGSQNHDYDGEAKWTRLRSDIEDIEEIDEVGAPKPKVGTSLWHDDKALHFLEKRLLSSSYDHVVLTGWKSLDLLAAADRRTKGFKAALLAALENGRRVSLIVGGTCSDEDLNLLLLTMRQIFSDRVIRSFFDNGRFVIAHDSAERPFHAKCWLFRKKGVVVDLVVGSFNLSRGSFLRNVEAAARAPLSESRSLVANIKQAVVNGRISPEEFAKVEEILQPKRPSGESETERRNLPYIAAIKAPPGPPRPGTLPPIIGPGESKTADYYVVLKDPSRGPQVGYQIPKELLAQIFGDDFLGVKENEMGLIEGPKSRVVPFPRKLAKQYKSQIEELSAKIRKHCTATSVGWVVHTEQKNALQHGLDSGAIGAKKTMHELEEFLRQPEFPDFLMQQTSEQIIRLKDLYARQLEWNKTSVNKKLVSRRHAIVKLARDAACQMLERLKQERALAFILLDDILKCCEGISRSQVEKELALR